MICSEEQKRDQVRIATRVKGVNDYAKALLGLYETAKI